MFDQSFVQAILSKIKVRAILVAVLIHAGLIIGIIGLCTLPRPDGLEASHWLAIGGLAGVYGGLLLGLLMVGLPLSSLVRKIRKLLQWREWILEELPRIIQLMPQVLEAIRAFFDALAQGRTVASAAAEAARQAGGQPAAAPTGPAPAPAPAVPNGPVVAAPVGGADVHKIK